MPKAPRPPEAVQQVRKTILDAAASIIYQDGFSNVSMRKIAAKTEMTAANLYNYFSGKDEIYLAIQTRGFAELHARFRQIQTAGLDPQQTVGRMIAAYIDFGRANPDQYEIMFTRNTPKYADYLGTAMEPAARTEKETALRVAACAERAIASAYAGHPEPADADPSLVTIELWTALHGMVSLLNSRVLQEVESDTDAVVQSLVERLTARFMPAADDNDSLQAISKFI